MLILNLLIFNPEIGVARVGRGKVATKLGSRFFTPLLPAPLSRPPQEFCQCCPNYCFEMLLRFFLFQNVARMFLQLAPPLPRSPDHPKNSANVVRIIVSKCCPDFLVPKCSPNDSSPPPKNSANVVRIIVSKCLFGSFPVSF